MEKYPVCAEIPFLNNFHICKNGDVFHRDENNSLSLIEKYFNIYWMVDLNGIMYRIDELLVKTYYGLIDLPIKYIDGNLKNCSLDNLEYNIFDVEYNGDYVFLNKLPIPFKKIPECVDYISRNGIVFNPVYSKIKKIHYRKNAYASHNLTISGKSAHYYTHRIVYITWVDDIEKDLVIDHLDTNKWNNFINNLEMVTSGENNLRAFQLKLKKHRWSKEEINLICSLMSRNYKIQDLYKIFDIGGTREKRMFTKLIYDILNKKTHADVSSKYDLSNYNPKCNHYTVITDEKYSIIKALRENGLSQQKIADILGISRSVIERMDQLISIK